MIKETDNFEYDDMAMDVNFFKVIGLYQLLNPFSSNNRGSRFSERFRKVMLTAHLLILGIECMQIIRLYLTIYDIQQFLDVIFTIIHPLLNAYKGIVLVIYADRLWNILDVAKYGFTSFGHRDSSPLHQCSNRVSKWIRPTAGLWFISCVLWIVTPLFTEEYVSFVKLDGTVGQYRVSILNLWLPLTESLYNWTPVWMLIYAIEVFIISTGVYNWILFDCYLMTVCIVLSTQFYTMSTKYQMLSHCYQKNWQPPCSFGIREKKEDNTESDYYNDLIIYIKDNQNIMEKFDEFLNITQPFIKIQVIISSYSIFSSIFLTILAYIMGWPVISARIMKPFTATLSCIIQFFIYCYVLNLLETAKSTLNFGLYSSNWTEMNLKYQKALLLAMRMNSANTRVMNLSPNSIINLEMFAKIMKMSYTIVSVLLNSSTGNQIKI